MRTLVLAALIALFADQAFAAGCQATLPANGASFSGEVSKVIAGDLFCVGKESGGVKVRLADFDSVDRYESGGQTAKQELHELAYGKQVSCVADGKSFDRVVAVCTLSGRSVGELLREQGIAEGGKY